MKSQIGIFVLLGGVLAIVATLQARQVSFVASQRKADFPSPQQWLASTTWRHESGNYTLRFTRDEVVTSYESYARKWVAIDMNRVIIYPRPGDGGHLSLLIFDLTKRTFDSFVLKVAEGQEHVQWDMVLKPRRDDVKQRPSR